MKQIINKEKRPNSYLKIAHLPAIHAQVKQTSAFCSVIREVIDPYFITFYKGTYLLRARY